VYDEEKKCAAIDGTGKIVIPFGQHKWIDAFHEGLAWVENPEGQHGVIDKTGKLVIPYGVYPLTIMGEFGGQTVHDSAFSGGFASVVRYEDDGYQYSLIDKEGERIVPFGEYCFISNSRDGYFIVHEGTYSDYQVGVIDATGRVVVPVGSYDDLPGLGGGFCVVQKDEQYAVLDVAKGELILALGEYDHISVPYEGCSVVRKGGDIALLDLGTGEPVVPFGVYSNIGAFRDGSRTVEDAEGKFGRIDNKGQLLMPMGDYSRPVEGVGMTWDKEGRTGVVDPLGNVLIPFGRYDYISNFSADVALAIKAETPDDLEEWLDWGGGEVQYAVLALVGD